VTGDEEWMNKKKRIGEREKIKKEIRRKSKRNRKTNIFNTCHSQFF